MPDGCTRAYEKRLQHSTEPGTIFWSEAVVEAATTNPAANNQTDGGGAGQGDGREAHNELLARVPVEGIEKKVLKKMTNEQTGIGVNRLDEVIGELIAENQLLPFDVRRKKGGRAAIHVRRAVEAVPVPVPLVPAEDGCKPPAAVPDPTTTS